GGTPKVGQRPVDIARICFGEGQSTECFAVIGALGGFAAPVADFGPRRHEAPDLGGRRDNEMPIAEREVSPGGAGRAGVGRFAILWMEDAQTGARRPENEAVAEEAAAEGRQVAVAGLPPDLLAVRRMKSADALRKHAPRGDEPAVRDAEQ